VGPGQLVRSPKATHEDERALCAGCPVRQECLDVAMGDDTLTGCWGGTADAERRAMHRRSVA
jgi:WhiB family transcriptional regulator, redox-sensing transcriptional regulator